MPEPWETLCYKNHHPRDDRITFYEPTHTYTLDGTSKGLISGTGFIHSFFGHVDSDEVIAKMMKSKKWPESKYFGMTPTQIKKQWDDLKNDASTKGTAMHLGIEQFLNGAYDVILPEIKESKEFKYFLNFWAKFGDDLEPYRAEWSVFSEAHKLCGQIDMLFRRKSDGKFVIYDWKRSKEIKTSNDYQKGLAPLNHLDDCNYSHYTLQLNIYRWILENLYDIPIAEMYLIICHPNNNNFIRMRLNRLQDEVEAMLACRKRALDEGWHESVKLPLPEENPIVEDDYAFLQD
jgi:hypothetical protein